MENNGTYRWTPPGGQPKQPKKPMDWKKLRNTVIIALLAVVLAIGATTCW